MSQPPAPVAAWDPMSAAPSADAPVAPDAALAAIDAAAGSHAALWDPNPDASTGPGALAAEAVPAPGDEPVDPSGRWWSPGTALMLAIFAFAFQMCTFYAREIVPQMQIEDKKRLEVILEGSSWFASGAMPFVGALLALGSVGLLWVGIRRGVRAPLLQGAIGFVALLAVGSTVVLPALF